MHSEAAPAGPQRVSHCRLLHSLGAGGSGKVNRGRKWRLAGASLVFVIASLACAGSPTEPSPTPLTVSLNSASWETIGDPQPYPLVNQGTALTFEFPRSGSIHYLFTPSALSSVHGTLALSFTITAAAPVTFNSLDPQSSSCTIPSAARPFFWSNDNGNGPYDRWWSNPRAVSLSPGSGSLVVPLKPENWSSVNGKIGNADSDTRYAFQRALLNVTRLGITFGGGCSFGHGVNISGGPATFFLTEFAIR